MARRADAPRRRPAPPTLATAAMRALYLVALFAAGAVAAMPPHAAPELPLDIDVALPPLLDPPAPSSLANALTLTADEAVELHSAAAVAKDASKAAVADARASARATLNATKAAAAAQVNASKALFMDSVVAPVTGTLHAGGIRGGALLRKANWSDAALLTSELALAKGAAQVKAAVEAKAEGAKDRLDAAGARVAYAAQG